MAEQVVEEFISNNEINPGIIMRLSRVKICVFDE
jgi:hypothetical protein